MTAPTQDAFYQTYPEFANGKGSWISNIRKCFSAYNGQVKAALIGGDCRQLERSDVVFLDFYSTLRQPVTNLPTDNADRSSLQLHASQCDIRFRTVCHLASSGHV